MKLSFMFQKTLAKISPKRLNTPCQKHVRGVSEEEKKKETFSPFAIHACTATLQRSWLAERCNHFIIHSFTAQRS